ncbi:MAG: carboxypeptidase regulatory-like domain-containing protein, partial [Candidatus Stahlbacteria bacterium]|nr:carboxypeptidase regulatory-like domain-containing protein [Candidatus Stahlbacteria bacterium]
EYHIHGGFGSAPDWVFNLNISQGYDFRPLPPIGNAVIAGKVMDENSNPVRAVVFFSDTNVTTDIGGMYKIELPQGNVIAYAAPVNKNAYLPSEEITKYIAGGEKETINFRVKSKPKIEEKPAILTGRVTDKMSTAGLSATISFPETSFPSLKSDISGIYRTELPTGTYVVKIEKEGYTPQTHPVVCKQGGTIVLDVQLFSPPRGATIAGKVVDYASRKGIAATISFLGATIPDIKTDIETEF